jgi:hypothetical protein
MNQPPDKQLLANQLDRARRELDPADADWVAQWVTTWWEVTEQHGPHRAKWCAIALLLQAARLRKHDPVHSADLADRLSGCAEAFMLAWSDELTVQTSVAELHQLAELERLKT